MTSEEWNDIFPAEEEQPKGIYEKMQETNKGYVSTEFTLEQFKKYMEDLFYNYKPQEHKVQLPAYDYPELSDEEFKAFVTSSHYKFIGGSNGVNKMMERCKTLGIEI
jgi:hypothetical protein